MGKHRRISTAGRHSGGRPWRVPRELRHHGGGHRAEVGCVVPLLVGVLSWVIALFVDTHRHGV